MIKVTGKGGLLRLPPGAVQQLKVLPRMGSTSHFLTQEMTISLLQL